ncbi:phosphotransferase [Granulicatella sp. zg-ZJ]|nr:phosphotransferase [Granulicatella sp. zg-ZJ]
MLQKMLKQLLHILQIQMNKTALPKRLSYTLWNRRYKMFDRLPFYASIQAITPIQKGYSVDKKFYIKDKDGKEFLLRLVSTDKASNQMPLLEKIKAIKNPYISHLVDYGSLTDTTDFLLFEWKQGVILRNVIHSLPIKQQYALGIECGQYLTEIHGISVDVQCHFLDYYQQKVDNKLKNANSIDIKVNHFDTFVDHLQSNIFLMKQRPIKIEHGDFHVGNMIYDGQHIHVIDWDRSEYGDPYDEFKPFAFNVEKSAAFQTGIIDGYFHGRIPDDFFPVLSVYAAEFCIGNLYWAYHFGKKEDMTMMYQLAETIYDYFKGFTQTTPTWYGKY